MPVSGRLEDMPLLEVLQVIAYSQHSGLLNVAGPDIRGSVIFERGNVIATNSTSSLSLLVKAAKESGPRSRLALRRVQALVALRELFDLKEGVYHFERRRDPTRELEGLNLKSFYAEGGLDTGDLLLVIAKMDEELSLAQPEKQVDHNLRRHTRFGPTVIRAELAGSNEQTFTGYVTNLSQGGAFFHAEDLPEANTVWELRFNLSGDLGPCQAAVEVVWVRSDGPGGKKGVGLAFEQPVAEEFGSKLTKYLERFQRLADDMDLST